MLFISRKLGLAQYSLSEVRFFSIPVSAREPSPEAGAVDVHPDVTLAWRAGREASTHNVYLSTDEQAVIDGTAPVVTVTDASHSATLDVASTYFWRIDEVNDVETPTTWQGDVWSFSTSDYLVVDDFESYNDLDPTDPSSSRIFNVWIDGYEVPTNGSLVGYENPPFTERTIVHGGKQSMPLFYNNTGGAVYSEAERTFTVGQDWTRSGVTSLVVHFYGDPDNVLGQFYVKVNGVKVPYDGDSVALTMASWTRWDIDLSAVGTNLDHVTSMAIGIEGSGSGVLYIDDIIGLAASGKDTPGEYYVFKALSDFPNTNAGEVPYYKDTGYRQALAIDAANVSYRGKFARAVRTFTGISDVYDVTITTVMEDDGESTYRLVVNGEIVADFQNPYVGPGGAGNGQQHTHIWEGIAIMDGDELGVESNTHSNQDIPESGGFAWSRGRWHQIELGEDPNDILPPSPVPPGAGLVHHWTLDADGTDSVSGLNGTVQGPAVAPGMVGNGMLFDGQDDSVDFTDFVPPLQGTIVLWMNAASVGPRGRFLGSVDEFEAYVENGLIANQLFSAGGLPNYVVSNTILVENPWYHVALTYDGMSYLQQIYIDGQLDAEGMTADDPWDGGDFAFGHRADRTNQYYSGMLDDVRYYDKVLTMEEVRQLMN